MNQEERHIAALQAAMNGFWEIAALLAGAKSLLSNEPLNDEGIAAGRVLDVAHRLANDLAGDAWEAFEPSGETSQEPEALAEQSARRDQS